MLVVEDSATVRQRLCHVIAAEPDLELIGVAADGGRAVELCTERRPDVITMDMMLPVMTGLEATEQIMGHQPTPILIVSSSVNRGELFRTYDALAAGAVDVLEKPRGDEAEGEWEARFLAALRLVSRIRVITHPRARLATARRIPASRPASTATSTGRSDCAVVAIGASTGGPGAVAQLLAALPPDVRAPILLVIHIGEAFGSALAEWLDGQSPRRVVHASDGMSLSAGAGHVLMAPPGRHLLLRDGVLRLTEDPPRHSCRPSVDVLFESLALEQGRRTAACLLTGMGRDGARGLLAIRQAGGVTIAQDEQTSVIYGMPREAALLGAAQAILPLSDIAGALSASVGARGGGAP